MRPRARPSLIPPAVMLLPPLALAACVAPPAPKPQAAAPPPVITPPKPATAWTDMPEDRGTWRYRATAAGSEAGFGIGGAPEFVIRCDRARRAVLLMRTGAPAPTLKLTTSYGATSFPAGVEDGMTAARLAAGDPFLDKLAFSRGRFSVEGGGAMLVIPAWAEPTRVIEDCRG